jgi:catechol 2,3-dioxygenase-like lactoylglutathione lyase family enzyme
MVTTRQLPSRLHHTAYTTKDMEKTRAFYEPMVLVCGKLHNNVGILQTKFRYREGHETRRGGP